MINDAAIHVLVFLLCIVHFVYVFGAVMHQAVLFFALFLVLSLSKCQAQQSWGKVSNDQV